MQRLTAVCLLAIVVMCCASTGCFLVGTFGPAEKHTGPVTVRNINDERDHYGYEQVELIRPNKEFFEMSLKPYYLAPWLKVGDVLSDIVYVDKGDQAQFLKATLVSEAPKPEQVVYSSATSGWVRCQDGRCVPYESTPKPKK